jgi:hypothetical protein
VCINVHKASNIVNTTYILNAFFGGGKSAGNSSPFQITELSYDKIHRFLTMVYSYDYHNSGHYPSSIFYSKHDVSCRCLKQRNVNKIYRFVRTSQEAHYVSATSPTG